MIIQHFKILHREPTLAKKTQCNHDDIIFSRSYARKPPRFVAGRTGPPLLAARPRNAVPRPPAKFMLHELIIKMLKYNT